MHLESVTLEEANGTRFDIKLEGLSPVLNVIFSPNRSGKTTLCRAIRGILWDRAPGIPSGLVAALSTETHVGRSFGATTHWSPSAPWVPDHHAASSYTLTIEELLALEAGDDAVIGAIEREFAGGLDFRRANNAIRRSARGGLTKRQNAIEAARKQLSKALNAQTELRRALVHLDELKKSERASDRAREDRIRVADALELQQARADRRTEQELKAALPELCARLRGDEGEELEKREHDVRSRAHDVDSKREALERAIEKLRSRHSDPDRIDEDVLRLARRRLEAAVVAGGHGHQAQRRAYAALEGMELDRERLGLEPVVFEGDTSVDPPPLDAMAPPSPETLERLDELLETRGRLPELRATAEYLEHSGTTSQPGRGLSTVLVIALVIALAVGVTVGLTGADPLAWVLGGLVAGLVALGLGLSGRRSSGGGDTLLRKRALDAQEQINATNLRIETLSRELKDAGLEVEGDRLLSARDSAERMARLSAAWSTARSLSAEAESFGNDRDRFIKEICSILAIDIVDEQELAVELDFLEDQRAAIDAARTACETAEALLTEAEAARCWFFDSLELEASAESRRQVFDALEQVGAWREHRDSIRAHENNCSRLESRLETHVGLAEEARSVLEERLASLPEIEKAGIEAGKKRAILEDRVEEERTSTEVSRLEGVVDAEQEAHAEAFEHELGVELADFMLRDSRGRMNSEAESNQLLGRIRTNFAKASSNAYTVLRTEIDETSDALTLIVRDNTDRIERRVDQLSTGIRVQLLICMRMSALPLYEAGGSPLPLVLDDALGNLDADQFRSTVDLLLELASDGRQILYLTHDLHDAQQWTAVARARKLDVGPRGLHAGRDPLPVELPDPGGIPRPDSDDFAAYARRVQAMRPHVFDSPEKLSPVYLFPFDLDRAWRLMEDHASTLGIAAITAKADKPVSEWISVARALLAEFAIGVDATPDSSLIAEFKGGTRDKIEQYLARNECTLRELIDAIEKNDPTFRNMRDRVEVIETLRLSLVENGNGSLRDAATATGNVCSMIELKHHSPADVGRYARFLEAQLAPSRTS